MADALSIAKQNQTMLNALIKQTNKLAGMQERAKEATDKLSNSTKELNEETEEGVKKFDRRTEAIREAIKTMNRMGKQFELLNYQSLQALRDEGGNTFEYLDMLLTSTSEQVKIMGIEAGTARRVLYGFFPPGMFSLVSKLSTGMKLAGAVVRLFSGNTDEAGKKQKNLFTIMGKGIGLLTKFRKKAEEPMSVFDIDEKAHAKSLKRLEKREAKKLKKSEKDNIKGIKDRVKAAEKGLQGAIDAERNAVKNVLAEENKLRRKARAQVEKMLGTAYDGSQQFHDLEQKQFQGLSVAAAANKQSPLMKARQEHKRAGIGLEGQKLMVKSAKSDLVYNKRMIKSNKVLRKFNKKMEKRIAKAERRKERHEKWQKFSQNKLAPLKEGIKMFMFGAMKAILVILAALVVFQALWPTIKEVMGTVIDVMLYGVGLVMEGVIQIFTGLYGIYEALMGGDLMDLFWAVLDVVIGFGKVLWGLISAVFGSLLIFVGGMFVELLIKAWEWVTSLGFNVKSVGKIVGLALMVLVFIKLWLMGAPIIVIIALGILAYKIGKWAIKKIAGIFDWKADGGPASGPTIVGERGPELLTLPAGSRVRSNAQTKKMMGGSTTNNINITINARDTSDSELRRIADKIGHMVNTRINRTTSSSTMR
jgi:ABC-type transporter Mla subunit MlaD